MMLIRYHNVMEMIIIPLCYINSSSSSTKKL